MLGSHHTKNQTSLCNASTQAAQARKQNQEAPRATQNQLRSTQGYARRTSTGQHTKEVLTFHSSGAPVRGQRPGNKKPLHRIKGVHRPVLHRLREKVQESGMSGAGSGHPCRLEEPKASAEATQLGQEANRTWKQVNNKYRQSAKPSAVST